MAVEIRRDVLNAMTGLHFTLAHFARGTFPVDGTATLSVNRLLLFESAGIRSCISPPGEVGFRLEAGSVCLIPAGIPAYIRLDDSTHFVSIQFNLNLFFGDDLIGRTGKIRHRVLPEFLKEAIAEFEDSDSVFPGIRIQEMLIRIFATFGLKLDFACTKVRGMRFHEALRMVENFCNAQMTVSELAEAEKMQRSSFSRAFAAQFGISPKVYLERALMLRAETFLRQPGMNVRKTAEKLCFSSEFYFSRFFRKHAGITPDEFRRQNIYCFGK